MKTIHRPTLDEFIQTAKPFLERDLYGNILSIRLLNRIQKGDYPDYHLLTVVDDRTGDICATAMKTDIYNLVLSTGAQDSFSALVAYVSDMDFPFPGINGPEDSTSAFATVWNATYPSRVLTRALHLQYYILDEIETAGVATGHARIADPSDVPLVNQWREAGLSEAGRQPAPEHVAKYVDKGEVMLWEDGGRPVCMVWKSDIAPGFKNVGPVYTPPQYRGNRYASACVTELSRRVLDGGDRAVLCADMANPTSNAIYQRIGYREKSIYAEYRF